MARALVAGEIVAAVLTHLLHDRRTLRSATLVSRLWAVEAQRLLWYETSPETLARVPEDRRQHFARWARRLVVGFSAGEAASNATQHLLFPHVARLYLEYPWDTRLQLAGRFPRLQKLVVHELYSLECQECVEALLSSNAASLRVVDFTYCASALAMQRLAHIVNLKRLVLRTPFDAPLSVNAARRRHVLFGQLTDLELTGDATPLFGLLKLLPREILTRLCIRFCELLSVDLTPLVDAGFSNLVELRLEFDSVSFQQQGYLRLLGRLVALRRLEVRLWGNDRWNALDFAPLQSNMTDASFAQHVRALPRLQKFHFVISSRITVATLITLGDICRDIEDVRLVGRFKLIALPPCRGRRVFPALRCLIVDGAEQLPRLDIRIQYVRERRLVASIVRRIRYHAPELKTLTIRERSPVDVAVMALWQGGITPN
jgi:hypothetical protein